MVSWESNDEETAKNFFKEPNAQNFHFYDYFISGNEPDPLKLEWGGKVFVEQKSQIFFLLFVSSLTMVGIAGGAWFSESVIYPMYLTQYFLSHSKKVWHMLKDNIMGFIRDN